MLGTVLGQGLGGNCHLEVGGLPGRDGRRRLGTGAAAALGLVVVVAGGRHGLGRRGGGADAAGAAHLGQCRGRSGRGGGLLHHLDLLPALLVGRSGLEGLGQLMLHLLGPAQVGVGGDRGLGRQAQHGRIFLVVRLTLFSRRRRFSADTLVRRLQVGQERRWRCSVVVAAVGILLGNDRDDPAAAPDGRSLVVCAVRCRTNAGRRRTLLSLDEGLQIMKLLRRERRGGRGRRQTREEVVLLVAHVVRVLVDLHHIVVVVIGVLDHDVVLLVRDDGRAGDVGFEGNGFHHC